MMNSIWFKYLQPKKIIKKRKRAPDPRIKR